MPDVEALYETLDVVTAAAALDDTAPPELVRWVQGSWTSRVRDANHNICGTAACFAGHRLVLDGYTILSVDSMRTPWGAHIYADAIEERAIERLGLTEEQANHLFRGDNTLERIKAVVDNIAAGGCGDPGCDDCAADG